MPTRIMPLWDEENKWSELSAYRWFLWRTFFGETGECLLSHSYSFYTVPRIEWERNDFLFTAATTVRWTHLPKQSYSRFCVSPFFCFRYKFTPRWKMSLLGSLDESEGGLKDIYPFRYREDTGL